MKMIIMMALILCSSCVTKQLVCSRIPEFKLVELCDISFKYNRCRCRMIDFQTQEAVTDAANYPIERCDGGIVYHVDDYAIEIQPKLIKLDDLHKELCD